MSRAWNLGLALTLCFAPTAVRSSEPASKPPSELELAERRLSAKIDALEKALDITFRNKIAGVNERLDAMQRDLNLQRERLDTMERTAVRDSELNALRDQVDRLRADLDGVRRSESRYRESLKPGNSGYIPRTDVPMPDASLYSANRMSFGTLRVTNDFPIGQDIVVNNRSYPVPPHSFIDISVPAGTFNYFVVDDPVGVRTRTIAGNRVFPIRIY